MERLKLSRNEKRLLRHIALDCGYLPDGMGDAEASACADVLESLGLVRCVWASGHRLHDAVLTRRGAHYLQANPHLRGPVDWKGIITMVGALVGAVAAVLALFLACSRLR